MEPSALTTLILLQATPDVSPSAVCVGVIHGMSQNHQQLIGLTINRIDPPNELGIGYNIELTFEPCPGQPPEDVAILVFEKGVVCHLDSHPPLTGELRSRIIGFRPDEADAILRQDRWTEIINTRTRDQSSFFIVYVRDNPADEPVGDAAS